MYSRISSNPFVEGRRPRVSSSFRTRLGILFVSWWVVLPAWAVEPIAPARLDPAMHAAANYLTKQMLANGQFRYRVNLNSQVVVPPKYNMLRHAGTMYALAQYQQRYPKPEVKDCLSAATRFLRSQIAEIKDVPEVLAVWSDPRIHRGTDARKCKLGGTGLGLVALCQLESASLTTGMAKQQLEWMGNFLLFMQKDDGGFYSFYLPAGAGRDDRWTSLYYPGEAALGLLMLDELQPHEDWRLGAYEALSYLAATRRGASTVPADHWALIATDKLLRKESIEVDRDRLFGHAIQIIRGMLHEQGGQRDDAVLDGCFSSDGRTTPTATRLEGLLALLSPLSARHPAIAREVEQACHRGMAFLLRAQHHTGEAKGAIPRAVRRIDKDAPGWTSTFNDRATEVRIDYVQHALSAMIGYRAQFHPTLDSKEE